jgi:hypothetical protein
MQPVSCYLSGPVKDQLEGFVTTQRFGASLPGHALNLAGMEFGSEVVIVCTASASASRTVPP